ncbi:hypothetical protein [Reichenbachiella versicolor]|uniref:hypothetical protein n=1 Tax=Reichenbachiella versicolor TaxID=1821036 RepID=UPI000D6DD70E|nr:hypothetical protein [Reichenbachiella versicolor]
MKLFTKLFIPSTLVLFIICCNQKKISQIEWNKTEQNCFQTDQLTINRLTGTNSELIGVNVDHLYTILDAPTESLLLDRGEKFFIYHLDCKNEKSNKKYLRVRINAIGLVREAILFDKTI